MLIFVGVLKTEAIEESMKQERKRNCRTRFIVVFMGIEELNNRNIPI